MNDGNAALQWAIETEDDYLADAYDDEFLFEDEQDLSEAEERETEIPAWVVNEFEYDMLAFED